MGPTPKIPDVRGNFDHFWQKPALENRLPFFLVNVPYCYCCILGNPSYIWRKGDWTRNPILVTGPQKIHVNVRYIFDSFLPKNGPMSHEKCSKIPNFWVYVWGHEAHFCKCLRTWRPKYPNVWYLFGKKNQKKIGNCPKTGWQREKYIYLGPHMVVLGLTWPTSP